MIKRYTIFFYSFTIASFKDDIRIYSTSDDTTLYFTAYGINSPFRTQICKFIVAGTTFSCSTLTGLHYAPGAFRLINNSEMVYAGLTVDASKKLKMQRLVFGSSSVSWGKSIDCPEGSGCTLGFSDLTLSADLSKVYMLVAYGATKYALFITLDAADGTVYGTSYKSSISVNYIDGISLHGDTLYMLFDKGTRKLFMYKVSTGKFTAGYETVPGVSLWNMAFEPSTGR